MHWQFHYLNTAIYSKEPPGLSQRIAKINQYETKSTYDLTASCHNLWRVGLIRYSSQCMHVQAPKVGVRVVYRLACHLRTTLSRLLNFLPITESSPLMVNKCTYHSFLSVSRAWFPLLPLNCDQRLFRLGHAQSDKTNGTGQKKSFALFPFHVQIFLVLRNFFCSEINQASFVSHIDLSGLSHIFTEWLLRSLKRPKGKQTLVLFSKQELMGFGSAFDCVGFSLGL